MIRHHPDKNLLLEYASGSLARGPCLVIAAHVQMCTDCRAQYHTLNSLGGSLLAESPAQPLQQGAFERVMEHIEQIPEKIAEHSETMETSQPLSRDPALDNIPRVLEKLLAGNLPLKWKKMTRILQICRLRTGQRDFEVTFHRLRSGGSMAEHNHRGHEFSVVLHGSFSDRFGIYSRGDFIFREPGQIHRPMATQDKDCLCFSAVSAPVAITGISGLLFNALTPFRPG